MKQLRIIGLLLILPFSALSQDEYEENVKWLYEILNREKEISFNISNIAFEYNRSIEIEQGWVLYTEFKESTINKKYKFHLVDIDANSIELKVRRDIDKRKILYQVWIETIKKSDMIHVYESNRNKKSNYFSLYFTNSDNADEFVFALRKTINFAPMKVESETIANEGYMVRNLNWEMSIDEVKLLEKATLIDDEFGLTYHDEIDGQSFNIRYWFKSNKLDMMMMDYVLDYEDYNEYLSKYEKIKLEYDNKYGQPTKYEEEWKDSSLKEHKNRYGYAVSRGRLVIRTTYENEYSKVFLVLLSKDEKPTITVGHKKK